MSTSLRSRRLARNHKRMARPAKLNLVSLMDIFTILVLFLIVNNGDVEVLQADENITLPESVSETRPEATLTIKVTATDIVMHGRSISTVDEALATTADTLATLEQALAAAAVADQVFDKTGQPNGRAVIIMGDRATPYSLLKRIIATCAATNYRDISLAVNSAPEETGVPEGTTLAMTGIGL